MALSTAKIGVASTHENCWLAHFIAFQQHWPLGFCTLGYSSLTVALVTPFTVLGELPTHRARQQSRNTMLVNDGLHSLHKYLWLLPIMNEGGLPLLPEGELPLLHDHLEPHKINCRCWHLSTPALRQKHLTCLEYMGGSLCFSPTPSGQ